METWPCSFLSHTPYYNQHETRDGNTPHCSHFFKGFQIVQTQQIFPIYPREPRRFAEPFQEQEKPSRKWLSLTGGLRHFWRFQNEKWLGHPLGRTRVFSGPPAVCEAPRHVGRAPRRKLRQPRYGLRAQHAEDRGAAGGGGEGPGRVGGVLGRELRRAAPGFVKATKAWWRGEKSESDGLEMFGVLTHVRKLQKKQPWPHILNNGREKKYTQTSNLPLK